MFSVIDTDILICFLPGSGFENYCGLSPVSAFVWRGGRREAQLKFLAGTAYEK